MGRDHGEKHAPSQLSQAGGPPVQPPQTASRRQGRPLKRRSLCLKSPRWPNSRGQTVVTPGEPTETGGRTWPARRRMG